MQVDIQRLSENSGGRRPLETESSLSH